MINRRQCIVFAIAAVPGVMTLAQGRKLAITSLKDNATVTGTPILLKGSGADPSATLEVRVLTDKWYVQDGKSSIGPDGTWTFGPVNIGGQGAYNNHTIEVTSIKGGVRGDTVSVGGIVRR